MAVPTPHPQAAPHPHAASALRWVADAQSLLRDAALLLAEDDFTRAVVVQDATGAIVAANAVAEQRLGMSWDQMIGVTPMDPRWQAVSEVGVPLPGEQTPAILALTQRRSVVGVLMGVLVPTLGTTVWLEGTAHPLFGPSPDADQRSTGEVCGVLVLFDDVSSSPRGIRAFGALVSAYRLLAENSSDIVLRADPTGRCEWISPSVEHMSGWRPTELIGHRITDLVHPEDQATLRRHHDALSHGEGEQRHQVRIRHKDGSYRWYSAVLRAEVSGLPTSAAVVVSLRDVDTQVRAQAELEASERHYRMLAENSTDVIIHARGGRLLWVSPAARTVLGRDPRELVGLPLASLVHPEDMWVIPAGQEELLAGLESRHTIRWYVADGSTRWFDVVARHFTDDEGRADGAVLRLRDVEAEMESRMRLEYQARHDQLTGLVNRRELAERLSAILAAGTARPSGGAADPRLGVAVAFCDVDHFKSVNDTYGHEAGDRLLQEVGGRICGAVRSGDIVARLGGDELVVVLHGISDLGHAMAVADKIRESVSAPVPIAGGSASVSLSIGVSLARSGDDVEALIRRADDAVYLAKQSGRNRVETFEAQLP